MVILLIGYYIIVLVFLIRCMMATSLFLMDANFYYIIILFFLIRCGRVTFLFLLNANLAPSHQPGWISWESNYLNVAWLCFLYVLSFVVLDTVCRGILLYFVDIFYSLGKDERELDSSISDWFYLLLSLVDAENPSSWLSFFLLMVLFVRLCPSRYCVGQHLDVLANKFVSNLWNSFPSRFMDIGILVQNYATISFCIWFFIFFLLVKYESI